MPCAVAAGVYVSLDHANDDAMPVSLKNIPRAVPKAVPQVVPKVVPKVAPKAAPQVAPKTGRPTMLVLKRMLQNAIEEERYEDAASLRDKIDSRAGKHKTKGADDVTNTDSN